MEFMGKHSLETFYPEPKINHGNVCYLSVYYGWWSFTFSLGEREMLTPEVVQSAKDQARALLMLDDDDDGSASSWLLQLRRAASVTPKHCSKRAVTRKGNKS